MSLVYDFDSIEVEPPCENKASIEKSKLIESLAKLYKTQISEIKTLKNNNKIYFIYKGTTIWEDFQ